VIREGRARAVAAVEGEKSEATTPAAQMSRVSVFSLVNTSGAYAMDRIDLGRPGQTPQLLR